MTGSDEARAFGQMVRDRRKALGLRQEDVVLATGVGRRYLIELEAGKATARLGPALMIARQLGIAVGLAPTDIGSELPPLPDDSAGEV
jgi:transcriptional regulator with XRE-family HTH domain